MITVSSSTKKYSPLYKLQVVYKSPDKTLDEEFEGSFTSWFSADGVFHAEPFQKWLVGEVEVIGVAKGSNAAGQGKKAKKQKQ